MSLTGPEALCAASEAADELLRRHLDRGALAAASETDLTTLVTTLAAYAHAESAADLAQSAADWSHEIAAGNRLDEISRHLADLVRYAGLR